MHFLNLCRFGVLLVLSTSVAAQLTCYNSSDFQTVCSSPSGCIWDNSDIWSNCNGTYPQSGNSAYVTYGLQSFVLTINSSVVVGDVVFGYLNNGSSDSNATQEMIINALFVCNSMVVMSGTVSIFASFQNLGNSIESVGVLDWYTGDYGKTGTNEAFVLGVMENGTLILNNGTKSANQSIFSYGTIDARDGCVLTFNNGSSINSQGSIMLSGNVEFHGESPSIISSTSKFTFFIESGSSILFNISTSFLGGLWLHDSTITATSSFYVDTLTTSSDSIVDLSSDSSSNDIFAFGEIVNNGSIYWTDGTSFSTDRSSVNFGSISISANDAIFNSPNGTFYNWGNLTVSSSSLNYTGALTNDGSIVINDGNMFFNPAHDLGFNYFFLRSGSLSGSGSITIEATFSWSSGTISISSLIFAPGSVFYVNYNSLGFVKYLDTPITISSGSFAKLWGAMTINKPFTIGSGAICDVNATFISTSGADKTFTNEGSTYGTLLLNGTSMVNTGAFGLPDVSSSIAVIDASLTLTNSSSLVFAISQTATLISVSQTTSNGSGLAVGVTLGGTIDLILKSGFNPTNASSVYVLAIAAASGLDSINISGNFSSITISSEEGANENQCSYSLAFHSSVAEITLEFNGCVPSVPDDQSSTSHTVLIVSIVVPLVVVTVLIIVVIIYRRRRQHHDHREKQRLI